MSTCLAVQAPSHVSVEMSISTPAYSGCFALGEENLHRKYILLEDITENMS